MAPAATAKDAVNVGKVTEPCRQGDGSDCPSSISLVREHAMCARQPLLEYKCRKGRPVAFEEPLKGTRRDALSLRNGDKGQTRATDMSPDVSLDQREPGRPDASGLGDGGAIAACPDDRSNEIVSKDEGSRDLIRRPIEPLRRQCEDFNA